MTVDFKLHPEFFRRDTQTRNRLGQELVECLVCTHTNLLFDQRLEIYVVGPGMTPWYIEMKVEESLSDDEDEIPHWDSDSESESDNDSNYIIASLT